MYSKTGSVTLSLLVSLCGIGLGIEPKRLQKDEGIYFFNPLFISLISQVALNIVAAMGSN
jgi:hypothetical protein